MTDFQIMQQKYYEYREEADRHFGGLIPELEDYVNALEEREKRMLDFLIENFKTSATKYMPPDTIKLKDLIESITGQTIEEVLKK